VTYINLFDELCLISDAYGCDGQGTEDQLAYVKSCDKFDKLIELAYNTELTDNEKLIMVQCAEEYLEDSTVYDIISRSIDDSDKLINEFYPFTKQLTDALNTVFDMN